MELLTKYDLENRIISFSGFSNIEHAIDIEKRVEVAFSLAGDSFPEVCYSGFDPVAMTMNIILFKEPSKERLKEITQLALDCILFKGV